MVFYFVVVCMLSAVVWLNLSQKAKNSRVQPWLTIVFALIWPSTFLVITYLGILYGRESIEEAEDDTEKAGAMLYDPGVALAVILGLLFTLFILR